MRATAFDEEAFFRALADSGARVLLIGRRALVALGLPVLTADYDLWIHIDDIERVEGALAPLELAADRSPERARATGRLVFENDEHVDVFVARRVPTVDGVQVAFDDVWAERVELQYSEEVRVCVPRIEDLVLTKRWAMRDKDVADIRLLEALQRRGTSEDE